MRRNLLLLMIITVLALAVMTACSPKTKAPTAAPTVAAAVTAYPVKQEPVVQSAATAYPSKQEPVVQSAATAYPAAVPATSGKMTDEQVLALIKTQLKDNHTMDFLLSKKFTAEQWEVVLNNESHNGVMFTPTEMEQVIAYLIAHQK